MPSTGKLKVCPISGNIAIAIISVSLSSHFQVITHHCRFGERWEYPILSSGQGAWPYKPNGIMV